MPTKSPRRWKHWASAWALAIAAAAACARGGDAPAAQIVLEQGASIRESGDSVLFLEVTALALGARGEYIATGVSGPRQIAFYDSVGGLVALVGPKGRGPGEFGTVGSVAVGPGDSLYVGDSQNGRITVLSPVDHRSVRTIPARFGDSWFTGSPDGRLMAPGIEGGPDGPRQYSIRRAAWGDTVKTPIASSVSMDRYGAMASSRSGRVWVADRLLYRLQLFDGNRVVRSIDQVREWFPVDSSPRTTPAWIGKGRPFITSVTEDSDGNLWVLIKRRNPNWTDPSAASATPLRPGSPMSLPPLGEIFEGVLEVIAPDGRLLDSKVVPGDVIRFIGPGTLYQRKDADSSGALMLQVWKASLRQPS